MVEGTEHTEKCCLNCGSLLQGKYCAQCGQKDIPRRQTLGDFFVNFIGSFTSFETKFFKTAILLLSRPWHLIIAFNQGRRESYFHPARAYVFLSFVFFLFFYTNNKEIHVPGNVNWNFAGSADTMRIRDTARFHIMGNYESQEAYDSIQQTHPIHEQDGMIKAFFQRRSLEIERKYKGRNVELLEDSIRSFVDALPKILFILLPVLALLLKLLYIRRDFYYTEHLVFSVVFYNFLYLAFSIGMILAWIVGFGAIVNIMATFAFVYLFITMKRVYCQHWVKTAAKFLLLNGMFFCIAVFVALIGFVLSFITL